jgi:hypothetical protein
MPCLSWWSLTAHIQKSIFSDAVFLKKRGHNGYKMVAVTTKKANPSGLAFS